MNIGIVTNGYPRNEKDYSGIFVQQFAQMLNSHKHINVFIYTPQKNIKSNSANQEIPIYTFPFHNPNKDLISIKLYNIKTIVNLFQSGQHHIINFINQYKIERLLGVWAVPSGYFTYQAHKKIKIPYDIWSLGSDINKFGQLPFAHSLIKKILHNAEHVFADGFKLVSKITKNFNTQANFLSTTRILPHQNFKNSKKNNDKFHFVFIGRLNKVKGIDILIKGIHYLIHNIKFTNFHLNIIGDGNLSNWLSNYIRKNHISNYVTLLGRKGAKDVSLQLQIAHAIIIPSRSDSIPVVLSEALQSQTPIIGFNTGDIGTIIEKFDIGIVVPKKNNKYLAASILTFCKDYNHRKKLFLRNIKKANDFFSINQAVQQYLKKIHTYEK